MNKVYSTIIFLSFALLPMVSFADVDFSDIETNQPLGGSTQPASVADFFAVVNDYDVMMAAREQRGGSNPANPLDPENFVSDQREAPEPTITSSDDMVVRDPGEALEGSASDIQGEGEVIQYAAGSRAQASVISSGANVSGVGIFMFVFLLLLLIIVARFTLKRKPISGSRTRPRFYPQSDGFHDMRRYHPRYR
jgi:hypothetical protein